MTHTRTLPQVPPPPPEQSLSQVLLIPPPRSSTPTIPNRQLSPLIAAYANTENVYKPLLTNRPGYNRKGHHLNPGMRRENRPQYLSLNDALYDDTQPEFDPRHLHPGSLTPGDRDKFLKSPHSPSLFPLGLPKPAPQHPFARGFEAPNWTNLLIHTGLCLTAYPFLIIFVVLARSKPLFWTRFAVSTGCGLVGLTLGLSLLGLGKNFLEAATWATVIHQSRVPDEPGVRLKDLAANSEDPTSAWAALRLLWDRFMYTGTSRECRRGYDRRPWSLFILFFLLLVVAAASLPFVLGRIVLIETIVSHQREQYQEIAVMGASSDADISRAKGLSDAFDNFALTWTLSPFSDHGGLPPVVTFPWYNDTVYFAETVMSQLLPNGSGFGTFDTAAINPSIQTKGPSEISGDALNAVDPGSVIRFPRWGTRLHCAKISEEINLVPRSPNTFTYVFTPRETLRSLFSSFDMDYPDIDPFNATKVLQKNDTLPLGLDINETALGAPFYDNGVAHSFKSQPISMGQEGKGWVSIEHVLVRLNTTYAPNGKFLRYSELSVPDVNGDPTFIGYDAAVCLQLFEPWILETYNSTIGLPSSARLLGPGKEVQDLNEGKLVEKRTGPPLVDSTVIRELNSTNLADVYIAGHQNSINQILKDNGRDAYYVSSPTVVSFTDGKGPYGYTELSVSFFAQSRSLADATNILPYFVGSGKLLARRYPDLILSSASIDASHISLYLALIFLLGMVAGFFVPKLPLDVPHRGFELYSWMAAFHADELVGEGKDTLITRNMELADIEDRIGELKFRYVNNSN